MWNQSHVGFRRRMWNVATPWSDWRRTADSYETRLKQLIVVDAAICWGTRTSVLLCGRDKGSGLSTVPSFSHKSQIYTSLQPLSNAIRLINGLFFFFFAGALSVLKQIYGLSFCSHSDAGRPSGSFFRPLLRWPLISGLGIYSLFQEERRRLPHTKRGGIEAPCSGSVATFVPRRENTTSLNATNRQARYQ